MPHLNALVRVSSPKNLRKKFWFFGFLGPLKIGDTAVHTAHRRLVGRKNR